jgi:putative sigma-54 modulation protein
MDITVTFRRMEPIESLKIYAEEKISKINKYFDSPSEAHIVLAVEKLRNRRPETIKDEESLVSEVTEDVTSPSAEEPTIEVEKLVAKPMDPEEAAMQLNLSQQDFLVFRNSRSREINVLYKRRDGNLGLIEPSS